jgi:hypothetical protein
MGISEMVIVYKKWNENNQDDLKKTIAYLSNWPFFLQPDAIILTFIFIFPVEKNVREK